MTVDDLSMVAGVWSWVLIWPSWKSQCRVQCSEHPFETDRNFVLFIFSTWLDAWAEVSVMRRWRIQTGEDLSGLTECPWQDNIPVSSRLHRSCRIHFGFTWFLEPWFDAPRPRAGRLRLPVCEATDFDIHSVTSCHFTRTALESRV